MTLSNLYESRVKYLSWPDHSLHLLHLGLNGVVGASQPLNNLSTFLHPPLSDDGDGDDDDDDDVDDVVDDDEGEEEVNLMMISREALKSKVFCSYCKRGAKASIYYSLIFRLVNDWRVEWTNFFVCQIYRRQQ